MGITKKFESGIDDELFKKIEQMNNVGGVDAITNLFEQENCIVSGLTLFGDVLLRDFCKSCMGAVIAIGSGENKVVLIELKELGLVGVLQRIEEDMSNFHLRRFAKFDNLDLSFKTQSYSKLSKLKLPDYSYFLSYGTDSEPDVCLGITKYRWEIMKEWLDEWLPISE